MQQGQRKKKWKQTNKQIYKKKKVNKRKEMKHINKIQNQNKQQE